MNRRAFLTLSAGAAYGLCMQKPMEVLGMGKPVKEAEELFKISLAQWSFHRSLFDKKMDNLDFAATARQLGIGGIEYVNTFFKDKAADNGYLREMKRRASDNDVKSLLIMCDKEGNLGDPDPKGRTMAVENHYKWVSAAKFLGCHSIRVNARSEGSYQKQSGLAADGLRRLSEYAAKFKINVIVENHGGLSSNGDWLSAVIREVNLPNCGTLPDFGNFPPEIDRYDAVRKLMPYAKAVSAKSHQFDEQGNETRVDYYRMMKIVLDSGYRGYVGIEYEGGKLSEKEGVLATRRLLEKVRAQYSS